MRIVPEKIKTYIFAVIHKTAVYIWLQLCQILTDFNNFCSAKQGRSHVFWFGGDEQWYGAPMIANKGTGSQSC